jgi:hypothetical protein
MKPKTKEKTARKQKLTVAEQTLREKAAIFQSEIDGHIRRVLAKPTALVILVNIIEMVGDSDGAQMIIPHGPNPPGWKLNSLALGLLQID